MLIATSSLRKLSSLRIKINSLDLPSWLSLHVIKRSNEFLVLKSVICGRKLLLLLIESSVYCFISFWHTLRLSFVSSFEINPYISLAQWPLLLEFLWTLPVNRWVILVKCVSRVVVFVDSYDEVVIVYRCVVSINAFWDCYHFLFRLLLRV